VQSDKRSGYIWWAILALGVAVLPLLVNRPYYISIGVFVGIYAIATMGLILLMGYAGQVSLGQAAFYGIGAYTSGILTTRFHLSPWLALVLGALLAAAIALIIGRSILQLQGFVLAGATFAMGIIFYTLFVEMVDWTGGVSGLGGIPRLSVGPFAFKTDLHYYYLIWTIALLLLAYSLNIVRSRVGRALRSLHLFAGGSEAAAQSLGVNVARYKIQVFVLSAIYASVAGSLYAHYVTHINPMPFSFWFSILLLVMATVGGLTSVWGAFLGSAIVIILREVLRNLVPRLIGGPTGAYEAIAFGLILILVLLYMPQGSYAGIRKLIERSKQRWSLQNARD
jgi:branched-chain amino acid transport system permease protein